MPIRSLSLRHSPSSSSPSTTALVISRLITSFAAPHGSDVDALLDYCMSNHVPTCASTSHRCSSTTISYDQVCPPTSHALTETDLSSRRVISPRTQIHQLSRSINTTLGRSDNRKAKPWLSLSGLVCSCCQQGYIDKPTLEAHQLQQCHGGCPRCRYCMKGFGDNYALYQHLVSPRHGTSPWNIVKFHCDSCGTTYPTYGDLERHCRVVHQRMTEEKD